MVSTTVLTVLTIWLLLSGVALVVTAALCRSGHLEDEHWSVHPPG